MNFKNMTKQDYWKVKNTAELPDFIIGGAMKSGTTSLHQILNKHPDVYMAKGEIGFFDIDNILEHPDFNFFDKKNKWNTQKIENDPEILWTWYYKKFKASNGQLKGEDSTTYLASPIAAKRIGSQNKDIKMIFVLRHPTSRTLSNYFHLLKSGRAEYNLEDTLQYNPSSIIRRSLYKQQLEQYYKYLKPKNIKVILFEELIKNPELIISQLSSYLNISNHKFSIEDLKQHSNKTQYPKSEKIQLKYNRLNRKLGKSRYSNYLPIKYQVGNNSNGFKQKILKKIHSKINPKSYKYKPTVNESTKKYLDDFFRKEMKGIDELTKMNIYNEWFPEL
jgi:hypothetical protein